jgi:twinfilin-like protein
MSHQTGIKASSDLREFFTSSKDQVRLMKISIVNEQLTLTDSTRPQGTWQDDWDSQILCRLEDKQPCYIFYRLDNRTDVGFEWIYISYSPDFSPVRQKMLYAATRATLKMEFGGGQIRDELFGTVLSDVSLNGYKRRVVSQHAPKPMTFAEEELEQIKRNEVNVDISVDTRHQTVQGIMFPLTQSARDQLNRLQSGQINYIQLSLDLDKEIINVELSETVEVDRLRTKIPTHHARYHLYQFKHSHNGDLLNSIVFIYSIAGYNCSVKERMLYSTCKSPLVDVIEKEFGLEIARKIEMDDPKELTSEFLYNEIHPKQTLVKQHFAKPQGPAGRGPKRLVRNNVDSNND